MLSTWQTKVSLALAAVALIVVAILLNVRVDVGTSPSEVAEIQREVQAQAEASRTLVAVAYGPEAHCGAVIEVITRDGVHFGGESPLNESEISDACVTAAAPYARWAILPGALALVFCAYAGRRMFTNRPDLPREPWNYVDG